MKAGRLNRRIEILRKQSMPDTYGDDLGWISVGHLWADPANETGIGAIRTSTQAGVSLATARYSFLVRLGAAKRLGIAADMRVAVDGMHFSIKGMTHDLKDRDKAYLLCEQDGSDD